MNETINYYDNNAEIFVAGTLDVEFGIIQNRFLSLLPERGYILDFGCGSGRDTKYFLSRGYDVDAIDGSEKLCEIASINTGIKVRQMLFSELAENSKYDGIWACASILHLTRKELEPVMAKMIKAVKQGGYIYTSFKYGEFEGFRNDRYFTDFTEKTYRDFINEYPDIKIIEEWVTGDARPGREDEKWLNLIIQRLEPITK
ncbi:Tellurite resistance protein TehB [Lachnospiraceae bacterium JC7]|nr:Tellurite resistance protein TehB [Lachnospiraceae bacterium JC7]